MGDKTKKRLNFLLIIYLISLFYLNKFRIHILSYIWNENGHNLFDYESDTLAKKELEIDF